MNKCSVKFIFLWLIILVVSCESDNNTTVDPSYSFGVISSQATVISDYQMTLNTKFFISGDPKSTPLTESDISGSVTISSSDVKAELQDLHKVSSSTPGNYSCAILMDKLFGDLSYKYFDNKSNTETFIRKFFKNAGANNKFLFSVFENKSNPVTIYGNGFTDNATSLDQILAERFSNAELPVTKAGPVPLIESLDYMLDYIHNNAPAGKRNLLLLSSWSVYNMNSTSKDLIISKAKTLGISVSTILYLGDVNYFTWDLYNDDLYYRLAYETGGSVYLNQYSDNNFMTLASHLQNIMKGDYDCFEATWNLVPEGQYSRLFTSGYFKKPNLEIVLQTGTYRTTYDMPFSIIIK